MCPCSTQTDEVETSWLLRRSPPWELVQTELPSLPCFQKPVELPPMPYVQKKCSPTANCTVMPFPHSDPRTSTNHHYWKRHSPSICFGNETSTSLSVQQHSCNAMNNFQPCIPDCTIPLDSCLDLTQHGLHHLGSPTEHLAHVNCVKGHKRLPTRRVDVNFLVNLTVFNCRKCFCTSSWSDHSSHSENITLSVSNSTESTAVLGASSPFRESPSKKHAGKLQDIWIIRVNGHHCEPPVSLMTSSLQNNWKTDWRSICDSQCIAHQNCTTSQQRQSKPCGGATPDSTTKPGAQLQNMRKLLTLAVTNWFTKDRTFSDRRPPTSATNTTSSRCKNCHHDGHTDRGVHRLHAPGTQEWCRWLNIKKGDKQRHIPDNETYGNPGHLLPGTHWQRRFTQKITKYPTPALTRCTMVAMRVESATPSRTRRVGGDEGMAENATPDMGPDWDLQSARSVRAKRGHTVTARTVFDSSTCDELPTMKMITSSRPGWFGRNPSTGAVHSGHKTTLCQIGANPHSSCEVDFRCWRGIHSIRHCVNTAKCRHHVGEQRDSSPKDDIHGDNRSRVKLHSCTTGMPLSKNPWESTVDCSCTLTNSSEPNGCAEDADASFFRSIFQIAEPELRLWVRHAYNCKQCGVTRWLESATVPDLCLANVKPQFVPQQIVDVANSLRLWHNVDVVMEREKRLSCAYVGLGRTERLALADGV